jgi:hypothetical protein
LKTRVSTQMGIESDMVNSGTRKRHQTAPDDRSSATFLLPEVGTTETTDPRLLVILDSWKQLPEALKVGILAMVQASQKGG